MHMEEVTWPSVKEVCRRTVYCCFILRWGPWLPYLSTGWTSSLHEILEWLRELENVTSAYIHKAASNKWLNYPSKTPNKGS